MAHYGQDSMRKLITCVEPIQRVFLRAIKHGPDHKIIYGWRGETIQNHLYEIGQSQRPYPESCHNYAKLPDGSKDLTKSSAIDAAPWPIDWNDHSRFYVLAGYILGIAESEGVVLRWGGDWDRDWTYTDQTFFDLGHFEVVPEKPL